MAPKTYYSILGISRNERPEGVRAAFRTLAKRYHPDRAGAGSADKFREIHEAYAVLSDPRKRSAYDGRLPRETRPHDVDAYVWRVAAEPLVPRGARVSEPLVDRAAPRRAQRVLRAEVIMTPDEARHGGQASLVVPCSRPCPSCGGIGGFGPLACEVCCATGSIAGERAVRIHLPPMTSDHAVYDLLVDAALGLVLQLDVRVG